jgi:hypothetical protein
MTEMSNRGDNGGTAPSFDVFSAVIGGKSVAEQPRSVVQKQGGAIRKAEAKRCREQDGMSSAAAFGAVSSFACRCVPDSWPPLTGFLTGPAQQ